MIDKYKPFKDTMTKKKLLILGATVNEVDVVNYAQRLGLYVIVTDSHTDWKLSPAKHIANEAWNISWSDIDTLQSYCMAANVDGIIAGFSEFRVDSMIKLCARLNKPCYINEKQLAITRDKSAFKKLCASYNIEGIKEYSPESKTVPFPVIVKPVDRAGSIGINVAYNTEQFQHHIENALALSPSKQIIIEEFIEQAHGVKFDCMYEIHNEKIEYIGSCDTVMLNNEKGCEVLQKAWIWPSRFNDLFINEYDAKFRKMISEGIGMKNGYCDISCFIVDNKKLLVFEAGFRLTGGHSFDYQRKVYERDYLETIIRCAMGMEISDNVKPAAKMLKSIVYGVYVKCSSEEQFVTIEGIEAIKKNQDVITFVPLIYEGFKFSNKPTRIFMCNICSNDVIQIKKIVKFINETVFVTTNKSRYCVYCALTEDEIDTCLKGEKVNSKSDIQSL